MSKIKDFVVSRWGDEGYIMEADYSQLEVIALAFLTQDEQLIEDVLHRDMHCVSATFLTGESYDFIKNKVDEGDAHWIKQRKKAKVPSFQLQYGSGAANMSKTTGIPQSVCEEFIRNYYLRYPGVKQWQDDNIAAVAKSREPSSKRSSKGIPCGVGHLKSITGREYQFTEYDTPEFLFSKGKEVGFSPTQIKNYPVQGLATGDIVPMMLGKVFRALMPRRDVVRLISTVHDSILLDVKATHIVSIAILVRDILQEAPTYFEYHFGTKFNLPLKVGISYGRSWGEQKEWTPA